LIHTLQEPESGNNMGISILVIEDDLAIQELIAVNLMRAGYNVLRANHIEAAQLILKSTMPDLIVLDWILPGKNGITFLQELRSQPGTRDLPVVMLTARSDENDKVLGLESGADDYITKPFSPREMLARIHTLLRRLVGKEVTSTVEMGGVRIDPAKNHVLVDKQLIALSTTEIRLLYFLMTHPERVHSRSQLLDQVWGTHAFLGERTVDAHVGRLRDALGDSGCHLNIETVRGIGYRCINPLTTEIS
jgi:two-component system phosphate regulon response regulator PhoB